MRERSRSTLDDMLAYENFSSAGSFSASFDQASQDANQFALSVGHSNVVTGINETMQDVLIPDFSSKKREGEILPTNKMTRSKVDLPKPAFVITTSVQFGGSEANPRYSGHCHSSGALFQPLAVKSIISSSEINSLKIEAIARLRQQGMDYLTSAAEFHKTLAMFLGLRAKFVRLIERIVDEVRRRGRKRNRPWRTINQLWDEFSSIWLEGRFGWRILYFDFMAITDYLNSKNDSPSLIVGRASSERSENISRTVRFGANHLYDEQVTYSDSVRVGYPGIVDHSILGNPSLLNTAWELIPFSLVLDWFFDIQSMIFAFANTPRNVKELPGSAFLTRRRKSTRIISPRHGTFIDRHILLSEINSGPVVISRESYSRDLPGSYSLALHWKPSINGLVWIDLLTLMKPLYRLLTNAISR